jgi:hypothetical protein
VIRPFQKSHNTAFRLLAVLLYGTETGLPYLSSLGQEGRYHHLSLRTGPASSSLRMTVPRMKEHLQWLADIGLVENVSYPARNLATLSVKLPIEDPREP